MAKSHQRIHSKAVATHDGQGASYEHIQSYDDSLLPEATELQRLKELDPGIIDWIKSRTEKEQDMRHAWMRSKMDIVEKAQKRAYIVDLIVIITAFLVMLAGMGFSALLILHNQIVTGSIFGGITIVIAVRAFLNFRRQESARSEVSEKKK